MMEKTFVPKSIPWLSSDLLGHLKRNNISLTLQQIKGFETILWNDLKSEYDADNFCNYLKTSALRPSSEFRLFEQIWRRDELNHYHGFRAIYSMLYDESEHEITKRLLSEPADFEPLMEFLGDEFHICLILAYDEIVTTISYAKDHSFYRSFGHPNFLKWIRLVTRDESYHFTNLMEVISRVHPERIPEIPRLIDRIVEADLSQDEYIGTFVLDHTGETFTPEFLKSCADVVRNYFKKRS